MVFTLEELENIYDAINSYIDTVSLWDFESKKAYEKKIDEMNDILAKIYKIVKE